MNYDKYISWNDLLTFLHETEVRYEVRSPWEHSGLGFQGTGLPISINECEFNLFKDIIPLNNLKVGYELATGTGISTLAVAIGMKKTGGKVVSCDAYVEECNQAQIVNNLNANRKYKESQGYRWTDIICDKMGVSEHKELHCALSPVETTEIIKELEMSIEFAFFDCPKCDADFIRDFGSIIPYLNREKFIVFIHDTHCYSGPAFQYVKDTLGMDVKFIHNYYEGTEHHSKRYYPMAYFCTDNIQFPIGTYGDDRCIL